MLRARFRRHRRPVGKVFPSSPAQRLGAASGEQAEDRELHDRHPPLDPGRSTVVPGCGPTPSAMTAAEARAGRADRVGRGIEPERGQEIAGPRALALARRSGHRSRSGTRPSPRGMPRVAARKPRRGRRNRRPERGSEAESSRERQGAAGRDHAADDPEREHELIAEPTKKVVRPEVVRTPVTDHAGDDHEGRGRQSRTRRRPALGRRPRIRLGPSRFASPPSRLRPNEGPSSSRDRPGSSPQGGASRVDSGPDARLPVADRPGTRSCEEGGELGEIRRACSGRPRRPAAIRSASPRSPRSPVRITTGRPSQSGRERMIAEGLQAAHLGHHQVHQDELGPRAVEGPDRLAAVAGGLDIQAGLLQEAAEELTRDGSWSSTSRTRPAKWPSGRPAPGR